MVSPEFRPEFRGDGLDKGLHILIYAAVVGHGCFLILPGCNSRAHQGVHGPAHIDGVAGAHIQGLDDVDGFHGPASDVDRPAGADLLTGLAADNLVRILKSHSTLLWLQKPQASEQGAKSATIAFYCYGAKEHTQKILLFKDAGRRGVFESTNSQNKNGLCFNCPGTSLAVIHD